MKTSQRIWRWIWVLIVIGLLPGCSSRNAAGFKKEYKLQVNVGPQTYWGMGAARFAELVREKTQGRINIKPYYGSQLLKGAQLHAAQMVAGGGIDLAFESTINTAPVIPELNLFCLPFFIPSYAALDRIETGQAGALLAAALANKNLVLLAWGENGYRQLTNSRRPIRTPDDLKGLKIRVVGSSLFTEIFRQLGADPVNMNWADALTALQMGTVDGQENPLSIVTGSQMYEFQKHMTLWNYAIDPLLLYWNKTQWDAFPADIQQSIRACAEEAAAFEKALCRAGLDGPSSLETLTQRFHYDTAIKDPLKYIENHGMTVYTLTEEEINLFKTATQPVFELWLDKIGRPIVEAAKTDMGL